MLVKLLFTLFTLLAKKVDDFIVYFVYSHFDWSKMLKNLCLFCFLAVWKIFLGAFCSVWFCAWGPANRLKKFFLVWNSVWYYTILGACPRPLGAWFFRQTGIMPFCHMPFCHSAFMPFCHVSLFSYLLKKAHIFMRFYAQKFSSVVGIQYFSSMKIKVKPFKH